MNLMNGNGSSTGKAVGPVISIVVCFLFENGAAEEPLPPLTLAASVSRVKKPIRKWIDTTRFHLLRGFCLCAIAFCWNPAFAGGKTEDARPQPKELIGKEIVGNDYPDEWRAIGNPFSDANYSLDGQIIYRKKIRAFVLRKVLVKRTDSAPRRAVVIDAVEIHVNPNKSGELFIAECKHPNLQAASDQRIYAEVRFKRCERYSSSVRAAWLIDSKKQKIFPISPKGMRCVDTFFNNGPDGPTCPPVRVE